MYTNTYKYMVDVWTTLRIRRETLRQIDILRYELIKRREIKLTKDEIISKILRVEDLWNKI